MILYHGGRDVHPSVRRQKELGIHCSPDPLEANAHFVTVIVKCDADVSDAVNCADMNNWASLEALSEILASAGVDDYRHVAAEVWRSNNCEINTTQSSAVMRDVLSQYGVNCIKYIDEHEIPGTECFILLNDQDFTVVDDLAEGYPNLHLANNLLPEANQIEIPWFNRPMFNVLGYLEYVPTDLFLKDPEYIAGYIMQTVSNRQDHRNSAQGQVSRLVEMLSQDYSYQIDTTRDTVLVCVNSTNWLDKSNPRINFTSKKVVSVDVRYNKLEVPVSADLPNVYMTKIKPFIDRSI